MLHSNSTKSASFDEVLITRDCCYRCGLDVMTSEGSDYLFENINDGSSGG